MAASLRDAAASRRLPVPGVCSSRRLTNTLYYRNVLVDEQGSSVASGGFELRLGTDRKTGDAVLRAGWHKSAPDPLPPLLPAHFIASPHARWTEAEVRQLLARLPARERRRIRWAAIDAGCASTEWQRRLLVVARFLLAVPIGVYVVCVGTGLSSMDFRVSATWVIPIVFWLVPFSTIFLFFALLLVIVREWAVRTARVPVDGEFEMLLNRVYPLRGQFSAVGSPVAPGANGDGVKGEGLAERAAP